jgi:hypothetical protein
LLRPRPAFVASCDFEDDECLYTITGSGPNADKTNWKRLKGEEDHTTRTPQGIFHINIFTFIASAKNDDN